MKKSSSRRSRKSKKKARSSKDTAKARVLSTMKWRKRMASEGRCVQCADPRTNSPYSKLCVPCAVKMREHRRRSSKRHGRKGGAWAPGRPGRPPLAIAR